MFLLEKESKEMNNFLNHRGVFAKHTTTALSTDDLIVVVEVCESEKA